VVRDSIWAHFGPRSRPTGHAHGCRRGISRAVAATFLRGLVAALVSPLTRSCGLEEAGPAMPPLVSDLVRRRHPFKLVRQHEVTRDCGPEHGGGGLLLWMSWSTGRIKMVIHGENLTSMIGAWRSSVVFCHHLTRLMVHSKVRGRE
jgi:hypothetical protein